MPEMETITVNQFRDSLREQVEKVLANHEPLKVSRRNGGAFVFIGAEDWEREQKTLYVLQNRSLMAQIARSSQTHALGTGQRAAPEAWRSISSPSADNTRTMN
jgi:antitoxin YefM